MFIRRKVVRGVEFFAVVESYRDAGPLRVPRQRTVVSLGRHRTAQAAFNAERERQNQLRRELDAARQEGAAGKERVKKLEGQALASAGRLRKLETFATIEVATRATDPAFEGQTLLQVAVAVGTTADVVERARAVRGRPGLWALFLSGEMNLKAANMRSRRPPDPDELRWLEENVGPR
jgi:hypothetical protein